MIDDASLRQREAADPATSTWLSANAGSGKTRVLTDRVARLLLQGVEPQRILCLTYTKAAASEMQNRLFRRLGEWAMLPRPRLVAELDALGVGRVTGDTLREARRLFARAIETPGGLKIQTIHSFCASLLRRFPLEAGVTPQFVEIDERSARILRQEVVEDLASGERSGIVDDLVRHWSGEDFGELTEEIASHRAGFATAVDRAGVLNALGLAEDDTVRTLLDDVFLGGEAALCAALVALLRESGVKDREAANVLGALPLGAPDLDTLAALESVVLFKTGDKAFTAKIGAFPTKGVQKGFAGMAALDALMARVESARPRRLALMAAERTLALHRFAGAFLPDYDARKGARGWLDFDDLIERAGRLLTDPSTAQWVLFRLDGGIDHILVDEAQDTSPAQWRVIELLAQEFSAGEGAYEDARGGGRGGAHGGAHGGANGGANGGAGRTIFVVGDKKQSIYSFQGADLAVFESMRRDFGERLARVDVVLQNRTLDYSFRSSEVILAAVDATLAASRGLGGAPSHKTFHTRLPGRVDVWPVIAPSADQETSEWFDPVDMVSHEHPDARLADALAGEIRRLIDTRAPVPLDGARARPITAGDVLILVRRRSALFHELIRACKQAGLPVAGADRLKLAGEMAIRDLGALLAFLVTPQDDLSLAAVLRSPLFGWSEGDLYDLAEGRKGELWEALRGARARHPETLDLLDDLRGQADFLRPYELIERVLTRHGGRRRLLARLGPEAEDGIDALLAQALSYERLEVPSLSGFVSWLASGEVEIKRQLDAAGGRLRVMTVHGAKGLEAPVVILPDTGPRRIAPRGEITPSDAMAFWSMRAEDSPPRVSAAHEARRAAQEDEDRRLLYVAMTRAEKWLIVCASSAAKPDDPSWHDLVEGGVRAAGTQSGTQSDLRLDPFDSPTGEGLRLHRGDWPGVASEGALAPAAVPVALEPWALSHAPVAVERERTLSPSGLGGDKALAGERGRAGARGGMGDEEAARRRGTRMHRLLEHLPLWPHEDRDRLGHDLLIADAVAEGLSRPDEAEVRVLVSEAARVLDAPDLGALFAPGTLAEVGITAPLPTLGGRHVLGYIDRLVVEKDRILAVDFKSNTIVPLRAQDVPSGYLRQMGAYGEALALLYPGRRIETALLWTTTGGLMPLPADLTAAALMEARRDLDAGLTPVAGD